MWDQVIKGRWKIGKPDHYPSGECPESVKELDTNEYISKTGVVNC